MPDRLTEIASVIVTTATALGVTPYIKQYFRTLLQRTNDIQIIQKAVDFANFSSVLVETPEVSRVLVVRVHNNASDIMLCIGSPARLLSRAVCEEYQRILDQMTSAPEDITIVTVDRLRAGGPLRDTFTTTGVKACYKLWVGWRGSQQFYIAVDIKTDLKKMKSHQTPAFREFLRELRTRCRDLLQTRPTKKDQ